MYYKTNPAKKQRAIYRAVRAVLAAAFISLCLPLFYAPKAQAATIIRDAEIEHMLKEWTLPVIKAADLGQLITIATHYTP